MFGRGGCVVANAVGLSNAEMQRHTAEPGERQRERDFRAGSGGYARRPTAGSVPFRPALAGVPGIRRRTFHTPLTLRDRVLWHSCSLTANGGNRYSAVRIVVAIPSAAFCMFVFCGETGMKKVRPHCRRNRAYSSDGRLSGANYAAFPWWLILFSVEWYRFHNNRRGTSTSLLAQIERPRNEPNSFEETAHVNSFSAARAIR